jgi:hypothetical protein
MAPQFGVRATGNTAYSNAGTSFSTDAALEEEDDDSDWDDAEDEAESVDDVSDDADKDDTDDDASEDVERLAEDASDDVEGAMGTGSAAIGSWAGAAARRGAAFEDEVDDDTAGISSWATSKESFRSKKCARKHDVGMTGGFAMTYPAMDPAVNAARAVNTRLRGTSRIRCMYMFISYYYTTKLLIFQ